MEHVTTNNPTEDVGISYVTFDETLHGICDEICADCKVEMEITQRYIVDTYTCPSCKNEIESWGDTD